MKVKSLGKNKTLVKFGTSEVLVSYETPVAGKTDKVGYFKTDKYFSNTTSRHINEYLADIDYRNITILPHKLLEDMLDI